MLTQLRIHEAARIDRGAAIDPAIAELLAADAPVAIGVSGGKDSCALAFATIDHLDAIGHKGPRVLVHSDLGRVEWRDSLPTCERLAERLGLELIIVRRKAGDMMDRWLKRWENNLRRYAELACVKLILPWSTPSMRFCTSELKTAVISAELVRRFPGKTIISASGIRRSESSGRSEAPISKPASKLTIKRAGTSGLDWNPLVEWQERDVYALLAARGFALHEGYTAFGMSRISCAFCIMGSIGDILSSASCPDNAAIYREMVDLEIASGFAFQGSRWLGDVAPELHGRAAELASAKAKAARRVELEAAIPKHLLYTKGWPTVMPTAEEAELLCSIRSEISELLGIAADFTEPAKLIARYAELMAAKKTRDAGDELEDN